MTPIESLMREWLTDPDPVRQLHARNRIAIGFSDQPTAIPAPTPENRFDAALARAVAHCPHRYKEACGCQNPFRCRASYGQEATYDACIVCVQARKE